MACNVMLSHLDIGIKGDWMWGKTILVTCLVISSAVRFQTYDLWQSVQNPQPLGHRNIVQNVFCLSPENNVEDLSIF